MTAVWPLTEAQAALWYAQRLDSGNPIFNTAQYTRLQGPLVRDAFVRAVEQTMQESTGLALRVHDVDGAPMGCIAPENVPQLQIVDCSAADDPQAMAIAHMTEDRMRPCDPQRDPLASQILFHLSDTHHLWYERVHHLATDGYGMALIDARVAQCYAAAVGQGDAGMPLGEFDAVLAEAHAYQDSARRTEDRAYWTGLFAQAEPVLGLAEGVAVSAHHFLQEQCALPDDLVRALRELAEASGVSWPDILLALCAAYVARMTGGEHTVVGAPYMGRLGSVSARVPAMVMNILPVPVQVDESAPLHDYVRSVARLLRRVRRHGRYRSEQLRRDLGALGGQRRLYGPLINVLPFDDTPCWAGLQAQVHVLCAGPVDDLTITFRGDSMATRMALAVDANPARYSEAQVMSHLQRLHAFLARALRATTLAEVPTLTPQEAAVWRDHAQGPSRALPRTTLAALIEHQMRASAQACALSVASTSMTYAELDRRTAALAAALQHRGVGPGTVVAVAIPRSVELVLALVAVLRAGGAYLPLDLAHPPERLATIVQSARPQRVLAVTATRQRVPDCEPLCVDRFESGEWPVATPHACGSTAMPNRGPAGPDDPAYVIYTSGSTSTPKGVVVNHDAIVNRLMWMAEHYSIGASDRVLQKTPATFDVSVWEFFLPLMQGAVLVVAPPDAHKDPVQLLEIMARERITTLHFVPSMLAAFLTELGMRNTPSGQAAPLCDVRRVFCSGEALPAATRDRFHHLIQADLHNLYGPTEAAVDVSYWPADAQDRSVPVPIGWPVWNTALYVLDACLRPAPVGVAGHLYIAGRQLAQGYLGRADLTEQRFMPDPFGPPGARMYATGDLARRRPDGALEFLGRSDHQVKIRGLRIELEEIEAVLAHAPGVAQVAVVARSDQPGQDRLVAYVVAHPQVSIQAEVLREHAAQRLPDYMVPAAFVELQDLPVTVNGKLDRKALPAPSLARAAGRAPASPTEIALAEMFTAVLHPDAVVTADDDFFALGGHSLLAAQLASAVRHKWGGSFSLGAVFEHPTVARLAQHLDALATVPGATMREARESGGFGPVLKLRDGPAARPALFCVHPAGGLSWCYGALARALPERTVYGLQARALQPDCTDAPSSLDDMAEAYADTLITLQPHGPYHVAGWSVGGIVAHAMAEVLTRRGRQVGGVIMLDAYPSDSWRDRPEPPPDAIYKALLHIAGYDPAALVDLAMTRDGVVDFLRRSGHPLGELPEDMIDGVFRVVAQNNAMVRVHHHQRYPGPVLYLRAARDHEGENLYPEQWAPYTGELHVHDVQTVHAHMVGAQASGVIAPIAAAYLAERDAVPQPNHRTS